MSNNLQPGFTPTGHSDDEMKREAPIAGALIWILLVVCLATVVIFLVAFFWSNIKEFFNHSSSYVPYLAGVLPGIF
jgi:hypothetical protein